MNLERLDKLLSIEVPNITNPTSDMNQALLLAEHLAAKGWLLTIYRLDDKDREHWKGAYEASFERMDFSSRLFGYHDSCAIAICIAAEQVLKPSSRYNVQEESILGT